MRALLVHTEHTNHLLMYQDEILYTQTVYHAVTHYIAYAFKRSDCWNLI